MKQALLVAMLVFCVAGVATAQIGLKSIGGGVGYIGASFEGVDANGNPTTETLGGFAIGVGANLGELTPGLYLMPEIGYWTTSKDFGQDVSWSLSNFAINGNVHYRFPSGAVTPYVGGGLGINFVSSTVKVPTVTIPGFGTFGGETKGSETRLGINLLGGASYALNPSMSIGGQFRYVIASDFNHFMILATFSHALGM
ncbi:MAG: porin family protein [Ignavibacteriales bacterium]|nr:porin family protein [Ignavibacteriales bacterium]